MSAVPCLPLADGRQLPQLGLGLWRMPDGEAVSLVQAAVESGCPLLDTASAYGNERGVGEGLRRARAATPVFVTTKLWNDDHGYDRTLRAFDASLRRLALPAIDLYLIHWPVPERGLYVDSWRALVRLRAEGRARSIGVSNFGADELQRIVDATGEAPAVHQVELHPWCPQRALRAVHARLGVRTQSWSPLARGRLLHEPRVGRIAQRLGATPAQVVLRWHLDHGLSAIPGSSHLARVRENLGAAALELGAADLAVIDGLAGTVH